MRHSVAWGKECKKTSDRAKEVGMLEAGLAYNEAMGRVGWWSCLGFVWVLSAAAQGGEPMTFSISVRTQEQIAAFYSARGFSPPAIEALTRVCFLTVGMMNRSDDVIWLEPSRWRLETENGQPMRRIPREEWEQTWQALGLPLAQRATFGWTQLPEVRDLQPGEPVAGNITVEPPARAFRLVASFRTGANGEGAPIELTVDGLSCPMEPAP